MRKNPACIQSLEATTEQPATQAARCYIQFSTANAIETSPENAAYKHPAESPVRRNVPRVRKTGYDKGTRGTKCECRGTILSSIDLL